MSDEIENLRHEFGQIDRQEKINAEINFRIVNLEKLISRIEKLEHFWKQCMDRDDALLENTRILFEKIEKLEQKESEK